MDGLRLLEIRDYEKGNLALRGQVGKGSKGGQKNRETAS
jgi:hypothetical protein